MTPPGTETGYTTAMDRALQQLQRLPGIGKRSAERIIFHLLKQPAEEATALAGAIERLRRDTRVCSVCCNTTETDPCGICADPRRDRSRILIVEQPADLIMLETTGRYRGLYHVLMGRLAPLDGVGPGELSVDHLLRRVESDEVTEVILGTNPTFEGDGTAMYLAEAIRRRGVEVTQLARGLPTGQNLEMMSKAVLADALDRRARPEPG